MLFLEGKVSKNFVTGEWGMAFTGWPSDVTCQIWSDMQ
jgi:hypothetical protein